MMSSKRRYVPAITIIAIAAGIAWWSSHTATSMSKHVQNEVAKLVPRFHSDPSTIHSLVLDPALEPSLASSLAHIYKKSLDRHTFRVVVTRGDSKEFGDGTATHVAMFQIDEKPVTGLRIIYKRDGDPLLITGIFSGSPKISGAATH